MNYKSHAGEDVNALLALLTLDEKISLLSAKNVWETPEIERVGIPSLKVIRQRASPPPQCADRMSRLQMGQMGHEAANSLTGRLPHVSLHVCPSPQLLIAHYAVKLGERSDKRR